MFLLNIFSVISELIVGIRFRFLFYYDEFRIDINVIFINVLFYGGGLFIYFFDIRYI